jgi:putative ABC transport system substrate-binding protein
MRRREFSTLLGGAATASTVWPSPLSAQKATPVIGYLLIGTPDVTAPYVAATRQGLSETGYVEGQNLTIKYRYAGSLDRLPAMAADLVGRKVDVIVAVGDPAAHAAKGATSTIPIVFASRDAVGDGLVASLARPGGNLTGVSFLSAEAACQTV